MALMKLLYRITITIICIVFFTGFILTSYSLSVQKSLINSQLDKKGQVLSKVLSASVMSHLLSYDFYTIKLLFDPLELDNDIVSVSLIGPDHIIKMHSDMSRIGDESVYHYEDSDFDNDKILKEEIIIDKLHQYLFFSPVNIDHNRIGVIHITLTDRESIVLIKTFEKRMLLLTAAVLMAGIIAAYLMSRQISNPIIELTEDIKRFLMKRPNQNPEAERANEVEILKDTFHSMMLEIQNSIEFRVKNEKMAVLGHLSSVLAHEVKNPLEPIKGSAELLKLKHPDNEDILKYTQIIQSEVSELITFLDSFLDVARSSNIKMEAVNIKKAFSDILILLEYTLRIENIRVDMELETDLPVISGDSGMIKQVFLNLMLNAIQAKRENFGLIEIFTASDSEFLRIRVKDHGSGIDPSIANEVFQPFFTTKLEGSGIGLSTSRHIINQHQGTITIESEVGVWTEVCIQFPIQMETTINE